MTLPTNQISPSDDLPRTEPLAAPAKPIPDKIDWWAEIKGVFWLILAVLCFHSFVAKPFYIPSESMMPGLLKGDRLVVSKFPYGWSFVSPTFHLLPFMKGRIWGSLPERGDVVIASPPGVKQDYIKRVIGLPGDRIEVKEGIVILNNVPVQRAAMVLRDIPVDANMTCPDTDYQGALVQGPGGALTCRLPVYRETLPNGRSYDTIDVGQKPEGDNFGPITVPDEHVFLMGDNRDNSADSRFPVWRGGLGGPVPWENIGGRAEFITFSLDGTSSWWNPISWFTALRGGRAGSSLSAKAGT